MLFRSSKQKTIYVHIGLMKTGTTAIQKFLKANRDSLEKNNFLFPKVNREAMNYLGFSLMDNVPPFIHHVLEEDSVSLYNRLNKEIDHSKATNVIISSEALSLISTNRFLGMNAPLILNEKLGGNSRLIKVIVYIRRQDDYLASQYNQHIKTHDFYSLYSRGIEEFYEEKKELFDFNSLIQKWENVFGEENIIVRPYTKNIDLIRDFLNTIDYKRKIKTDSISEVNPSLSAKELEFMRIANELGIKKRTSKQNYNLTNLISSALRENDNSYRPPVDLQRLVLEDNIKGNTRISDKYFGGDKSWFEKLQIDSDISESFNGLTIKEAVKVAVAIWNQLQNQ